MNRFQFEISKPDDKFVKPFLSTWIYGENVIQAQAILALTYESIYGFKLKPMRDWNKEIAEKTQEILSNISLTCASL